jgi:hypothetical protein
MDTYKVSAQARTKGAIGMFYHVSCYVKADNENIAKGKAGIILGRQYEVSHYTKIELQENDREEVEY